METKSKKRLTAVALTLAMALSLAACGDNPAESVNTDDTTAVEFTTTTTQATTLAPNEGVINAADSLANATAGAEEIEVTKKLKWLAWYDIDETQAAAELFKKIYGIPEQGSTDYAEDQADRIFSFQMVGYDERYSTLANLIQSGDSPDIFPFQVMNFPYAIYQNLYQTIDGVIDTSTPEWDDTREALELFKWKGKNYCPIISVGPAHVLFYRRSIMEGAGFDDPAELFRAGEWTWDVFKEMCSKFSSPDESLYGVDGWYVQAGMLATTGTPMISIEDGNLKLNLFEPSMERVMDLLTEFAKQDYRLPWGELGGVSFSSWGNGNTLFYNDGTWAYGETLMRYKDRNGWDDNEIMVVPFPRDPNADDYYQLMDQTSFMLVSGSQNVEGYKAWIQCSLAASKDPAVAAASRQQQKDNFNWNDEQLDMLDEINKLKPVFDFKNGIGQDVAGGGTSDNAVDRITDQVYVYDAESFTQLREANRGVIEERIAMLNAS